MSATDPCFWVTVFVGEQPVDLTNRVLSLALDEEQGKTAKMTMQVDNFDLSNFDKPDVKTGNRVEFSFGYPGNMSPVRQGLIQKVKGFTTLDVEVLGLSVMMNKFPRTRVFEKMTLAQVARQIAKENGYAPSETVVDDAGVDGTPLPVEEQVTQSALTDAALLTQWGKKLGFVLSADFNGFHYHPKRLGEKPVKKLVYYLDGTGDITAANIENDVYARKTGGVTAKGRDPLTKETIEVKADNTSTPGRTTLAPTVEIITGISSRDGTTLPDTMKAVAATTVVPTTAATAAQAKQQAAATYAGAQMGAIELMLTCKGDPCLLAEAIVEVEFPGAKTISGNYYLKAVNQKLGAGFTTELKCLRDGKTGAPGGGKGGGSVPTKGAQNTSRATPADPLGLIDLTRISERDGTATFTDNGGRQGAAAPTSAAQSDDPLAFFRPDSDPTDFYK